MKQFLLIVLLICLTQSKLRHYKQSPAPVVIMAPNANLPQFVRQTGTQDCPEAKQAVDTVEKKANLIKNIPVIDGDKLQDRDEYTIQRGQKFYVKFVIGDDAKKWSLYNKDDIKEDYDDLTAVDDEGKPVKGVQMFEFYAEPKDKDAADAVVMQKWRLRDYRFRFANGKSAGTSKNFSVHIVQDQEDSTKKIERHKECLNFQGRRKMMKKKLMRMKKYRKMIRK